MTEEKKLTQDDKVIAALSYIWLLFLVPLLLKKKNEFCFFHAKQGMVLFIFSLAVLILGAIPILGWLIITPLGWIIVGVLSLLGFINALQGKKWEMPYIGRYAKKINI